MTDWRASPGSSAAGGGRIWTLAGMCAAVLVAAILRCHSWFSVFPEEGVVHLLWDDSAYHARRAFYTFVNFPSVLVFDPYIAFPAGAAVPMPPLYDWLLGSVARLFGDSQLDFERVVAFSAFAAAVLTLLPVYALGRALGGAAAGVAAAWIFAVLPASSQLSSVGNVDHHAAVALLATCWLLSLVREALPGSSSRTLRVGLHGLIVGCMLLVWSGSLLYLVVGEGARLLVAGVLWRRPERLRDQAAGALVALALVTPWVATAPVPIGGPFSSTTLSWLHLVLLAALAVLTAAIALLEKRFPEGRVAPRAARLVGLALFLALLLVAIPHLRGALTTGIGFLGGDDSWAIRNAEQQPLFAPLAGSALTPTLRFGWFGYLVPALPVLAALGLLDPKRREAWTVMLVWVGALAGLALLQLRFATDLTPSASVVFAFSLCLVARLLRRRLPSFIAALVATALGITLLWPALTDIHWARARSRFQAMRQPRATDSEALTPAEGMLRFAQNVRDATPETRGFLDGDERPEYGLLVPPYLGHLFVYAARRPVPANNFGPYLDLARYQAANEFYAVAEEGEAFVIARDLEVDFVVTKAQGSSWPQAFWNRLHLHDGSRIRAGQHVERFRLVTEEPATGASTGGSGSTPAYKLFERVEGAVIRVPTQQGAWVNAELELETRLGRRYTFAARARAEEDAFARIRVPYSTQPVHPVRAQGPYRLMLGDAECDLEVPDEAVRSGATLEVSECAPRD